MLILLFGLVAVGNIPIAVGELCFQYSYSYYYKDQRLTTKYCSTSCCGTTSSRFCCSSYYYSNYYYTYSYTDDTWNAGVIVGIAVGSVAGFFILCSICVCISKACTKSGQTGRIIQPAPGIAVVSSVNTPGQINYPYNNGVPTTYHPQGFLIRQSTADPGPSNLPGQIPLDNVTTKQ